MSIADIKQRLFDTIGKMTALDEMKGAIEDAIIDASAEGYDRGNNDGQGEVLDLVELAKEEAVRSLSSGSRFSHGTGHAASLLGADGSVTPVGVAATVADGHVLARSLGRSEHGADYIVDHAEMPARYSNVGVVGQLSLALGSAQ